MRNRTFVWTAFGFTLVILWMGMPRNVEAKSRVLGKGSKQPTLVAYDNFCNNTKLNGTFCGLKYNYWKVRHAMEDVGVLHKHIDTAYDTTLADGKSRTLVAMQSRPWSVRDIKLVKSRCGTPGP